MGKMRTSEDEKAAAEAIACLKDAKFLSDSSKFTGYNEPTQPTVNPLAPSIEGNKLDSVWIEDNWFRDSKIIVNRTLPTGNYSSYVNVGFGDTAAVLRCVKQPKIGR